MDLYNISDNLSVPKDVLCGATLFKITGQYEAYIENFKKIIRFNQDEIVIRGNKCVIMIKGTNIKIAYFSNGGMKIKGRFKSIEFSQ